MGFARERGSAWEVSSAATFWPAFSRPGLAKGANRRR
jgi:hypothetical protein